MSNVIEARDEMIEQLRYLEPGSDNLVKQVQAIKTMSDIDRDDRRLEFERDKEETRKLEKSNEYQLSEYDRQLRWIDLGIKLIDVILNPGERLLGRVMNNKVKIKRDIMGYQFEENGVIGSTTYKNSQRDKYD